MFSVVGLVLVQEIEAAVVEYAEELVPRHLLQLLVRLVEIEAQDLRALDQLKQGYLRPPAIQAFVVPLED